MKLYLIACCVAAAFLAGHGYEAEDLDTWHEEAKEEMQQMEDEPSPQFLDDNNSSSGIGPTPSKLYPHNCKCKSECKKLHSSRVPFTDEDKPNYLAYENFPVLCRDAAATMLPIGEGKLKKKYVCKQTFDCCRQCNHMFYVCLKKSNQTYGYCMRAAYKCMCDCIERRSHKELPYKPTSAI